MCGFFLEFEASASVASKQASVMSAKHPHNRLISFFYCLKLITLHV